jgi:NodT family efflux transporter outer membrane factor (OMF) lipoprotein
MHYRLTFCFAVLALGSGCFHSSKQDMAAIEPVPSCVSITEKLLQADLTPMPFVPEKWWDVFEDPQLSSLMYRAIKRSPTLQEAGATIQEAQAEVKIARGDLFPKLHAHGEEDWEYLSKYGFLRDFFPAMPGFPVPAKFNEIDLSLQFSYELDFFGKNQKKLKIALGQRAVAEMERRQTELLLCSSLAYAYFNWQAHFATLVLKQKEQECEEKLILVSDYRYQHGTTSTLPSLLQKRKLEAIKQEIIDLEKEIVLDELFIKNLLGDAPDRPLNLQFCWNPSHSKKGLPASLNFDLLAQRPDIMAQVWRIEVARQNIGLAKAEFYPNVNLMAFAGLSSLTFSHLFRWASRVGGLNPAIHLPLFVGGKLEGNLEEKTAKFNQMVYSYNTCLLKAAQEVASEVQTFLSINQQMESQVEVLRLQRESLNVHSLRYAEGLDDVTSLLFSQKNLLTQEGYEVQLQQYKILSLIRLLKSLGGGFSSEEQAWNP